MSTRKSIDLDDILAKEISDASDMIIIDAEDKVSKKSIAKKVSKKKKKVEKDIPVSEPEPEPVSKNTNQTQLSSIVSKLMDGVVIEEGELFNGEEIKNLGNMKDVDFLNRRKREDREFREELDNQWEEQNMDKNIAGIEIENFADINEEDYVTEPLPDEDAVVEKTSNSQIDKLIEDLLK